MKNRGKAFVKARAAYPDPWPQTEQEVRRWKIADPYDRYFQNRVDVIAELFAADPESIDGIALAAVCLGALAEFRFASEVQKSSRGDLDKDQICFRRLLTEHCPIFVNRISIQEMRRAIRRDSQFARYDEPIRRQYPINAGFIARTSQEDPLATEFNAWADAQQPPIPAELRRYDYAGCIHRHYRNAVIHELRVAKGREASSSLALDPEDYPVFYANQSGHRQAGVNAITEILEADPVEYMRFGIHPPYLLSLLREAIASLREWALANDRHIFPDD